MTQTKRHEYTITATVGKWVVCISPTTNYGYTEHGDSGEGGGLWFDDDKTLTDYDGVAELAPRVITAIESMGYDTEYAK